MRAWLVSAASGDIVPGGVDIALLDGLGTLADPAAVAWMEAQGFAPGNPDECMYLTPLAPPDGFPSRRLDLSPADASALEDAAGEMAGDGWAAALERLRAWRRAHEGRDEAVRGARVAGLSKHRIHQETGISRSTIDGILSGCREHDTDTPEDDR